MEKEPKLKTKLEFHFNTDDMEVPILDFLSEDPESTKQDIRTVKKVKKQGRKPNPKLF